MKQALTVNRILVTNDDGINAEGIGVLEKVARQLCDDVWVISPEQEQSGAGHSLTLHHPLRIRELSKKRYAVSGTPTDCILLSSREIMKDSPPDLILSGVNRGSNVAEDITYSGTIAATMEGTLIGIPSIAFSLRTVQEEEPKWDVAAHFAPDIIRNLLKIGWPKNNLINVNFPNFNIDKVKGIKLCPQGSRMMSDELLKRKDPKDRDYYWIGGPSTSASDHPGADDVQLAKGFITITPLCLDLTNYQSLEVIREHFELISEKAE